MLNSAPEKVFPETVHMTLTLITLGRAVVLSFSTLALACGALPQFSSDDVGCRTTVNERGEAARSGVRWSHIDDDRDRRFQNAWCVGVGPALVWHAPEPVGEEVVANAGASASAASSDSIATSDQPVLDSLLVVAYNAHIGSGDMDDLVGDIRSGALTGKPVRHFVLVLQEV